MKLVKNQLFRNIFLMSSATIIAQLINVLVQPILTRIVPPEVLGEYTYLISLANIIIPVASLKLDMLIVSEKEESIAQYLTDACILICAFVSVLYLVVIGVGYLIGLEIFRSHGALIFIVPLVVFTNGVRFIFIGYNNRYKQYKVIGIVGIIRESARAIIQIVSGIFSFGVFGQIIGYAIAPFWGFRRQTRDYISSFKGRQSIDKLRFVDMIKIGQQQILYLVPSQFINSFANSIVIIFISTLFTADQLGYYSAGTRLLEIPMIFIASSVSKVCYKQISEDVANRRRTMKTFGGISAIIGSISFAAFGMLFFIAPQFAGFVFGDGYEIAGTYIRCYCLMYAVRLVSSSFAGLFTIFSYQKYELFVNIFLIICSALCYIYAKLTGINMVNFLILISVVYTIVYLSMWGGYFALCYKHDLSLKQK